MTIEDLLKTFPRKRVKPTDGMAVTAEVWEESHQTHREAQRLHALFAHGPGILTGLEVIASDPPDRSVYILPGIAVDSTGRTIVLPEPVAYDFGDEIEGFLHLFLGYGESRPRRDRSRKEQDGPLYVYSEFSLMARPVAPDSPTIELARLTRESRTAPLENALDPAHPRANEIDLRFRRELRQPLGQVVTVAVTYLGDVSEPVHGRGVGYLARALNRGGEHHVVVDDGVSLAPGIQNYGLIYLVGEGSFELSRSQIKGLQGYVERGGTVFVESCDADAAAVFEETWDEMGVKLGACSPGHPLLREPNLFAAFPPGSEAEDSPVTVGEGVVYSQRGYGRLWFGERRDSLATREQIRSAIEWGANLVTYAQNRQRQLGRK